MSCIEVGCRLNYSVRSPAIFLLNVSVARNIHQTVSSEALEVHPFQQVEECEVGSLGNRIVRINAPPGELTIHYHASVQLQAAAVDSTNVCETDYELLPPDMLSYLNPSRYCESDKLYRFAFEEFGQLIPGYSRVTAICNWTFEQLSYTPGSTGPTTTACDVLLQRTGVCRDYAHVAISLCRAMGIPARYVSGYAVNLQPPDFHGFFEAYLDGRWFLFDATRLAPVGGLVRIGTGRDAADVAFATIRGDTQCNEVDVWAHDLNPGDDLLSPDNVQTGVSSA
ncbi:transglutaminase-like domain-containing protein [Allorhodopirellula heiligendammensis]|uniref:Transglutaminase-like superfamily protein n=1 Tax=Allorhodopirellula heiligendammensis TaxID=2714739 RepID=A0A5C6BFX9_9BACT|nr:transglutaminase family protein [Allorhodopirellula heiligendammensis]TWU10850.1 Transglutaminase-like superfamily protein [Allorhodopirellula heiligendammensis]|tara:strand:+ start:1575 stop:2417 length:843 start_codon:yes stop_codon:yes gene_type:complete